MGIASRCDALIFARIGGSVDAGLGTVFAPDRHNPGRNRPNPRHTLTWVPRTRYLRTNLAERKMVRLFLAVGFVLSASLLAQTPKWSEQQANDWYAKQPWLVGSNYI